MVIYNVILFAVLIVMKKNSGETKSPQDGLQYEPESSEDLTYGP